MASRKADKEAARQRRLEQEAAAKAATQRKQRLTIAGSLLVVVIALAVVLVIVLGGSSSSSGSGNSTLASHPESAKTKTVAAQVDTLLKGIPQHGNTLGNPKAPVTFTEYGDLECPICKEFALGAENQLITNEVRTGKVKLVYKSLPTATLDLADGTTVFPVQQSAAYAAGAQNKAWNYIELFYHEQGTEDTSYVNASYLTGLAKQIPGLNVSKWNTDRSNPKYAAQVQAEEKQATSLNLDATPSLIATGPTSQTKPVSGDYPYSYIQSMIKSVS
jgi:protein-disulfide isomerase